MSILGSAQVIAFADEFRACGRAFYAPRGTRLREPRFPTADIFGVCPMSAFALKSTIRIFEPDPFGEVTLAPAAITGRPEAELARSMADALVSAQPSTGTEALSLLRRLFPDSPLTVRVAALDALMRR
jgi:hypothetical protein